MKSEELALLLDQILQGTQNWYCLVLSSLHGGLKSQFYSRV